MVGKRLIGVLEVEHFLTEWEDGWRVRLPLPFQLKWIYAYIIRERDGYAIVDCGLHYDEGWDAWQEAFQQLNIEPREVKRIVVTHYHPDHYGMAGRLQQVTGAEVWLSSVTRDQVRKVWQSRGANAETMTAYFRRHSLPEDVAQDMWENLRQFESRVSPHPEVTTFSPGDRLLLGGRTYHVWATPGHAEGHVSFYDPGRRWLIAGDVLLRKISPNISLFPGGDPNPLRTYLATLDMFKSKTIDKVLPAHGPVFEDAQTRIDELMDHHRERLAQVEALADGTRSAYDICLQLFGTELSVHNLRFAMAETLAHLEYLHQGGRLALIRKGDRAFYERGTVYSSSGMA